MREEQRAAVPEDSRRPVVRFDGDCGAEVLWMCVSLICRKEIVAFSLITEEAHYQPLASVCSASSRHLRNAI